MKAFLFCRACVKIGKMKLYGTPNDQEVPLMIRNANEGMPSFSVNRNNLKRISFHIFWILFLGTGDDALPLVDFVFETNPLNKEDIDQCINAVCQPLEIIYDAVSNVISRVKDKVGILLHWLKV